MISYLFLMLLPMSSALEFTAYPTEKMTSECQPLDFRSTSQARNAEELLRKNNPDRARANYAGKYLLLRVPYMMETEWLIADCASGKFFKETLSGEAEFQPESALIRITRDKTTHWSHWTGETFARIDETLKSAAPPVPRANGTDSAESLLEKRYAEAFQQYRTEPVLDTCARLDFRSYFRAQQAEGQILKAQRDLSRPNFAGHYLILQVDLLFETLQLIADCKTGKFAPEFKSGRMLFKKDSGLALLIRKDASPDLLVWKAPEWIHRPDPTARDPREVENELRGESARSLLTALPNPLRHTRIEFKDLLCRIASGDAPATCNLELDDPQATEKKFTLTGDSAQKGIAVLERYGVRTGSAETGWNFAARRGFCSTASGACTLFLR